MADLSKGLKIKISFSVLWSVFVALFALLAADGYGGFNFGTFVVLFIFFTLPLLIYWLGFWIWGEGYFFKSLKQLFLKLKDYSQLSKTKEIVAIILVVLIIVIVGESVTMFIKYIMRTFF
jgi:hypothetical protein